MVCFGVDAVKPLRCVVGSHELSIACTWSVKEGHAAKGSGRGVRELDMCTTAARSAADGRISCVFDWFASSSTWMQPWLSPTNTKLWPTNTMLEGASAISQANRRVIEGMAALIIAIAVIEGVFRTLIVILQSFSPADSSSSHEAKEDVRLRLGRWLALALEFLLAAGILRTAVAPTW